MYTYIYIFLELVATESLLLEIQEKTSNKCCSVMKIN